MPIVDETGFISLASIHGSYLDFNVQDTNAVTVHITPSSWGTAVVELKWSLDGENYNSFVPAATMSTSNSGKINISTVGVRYVRLETTTADGTADAEAEFYLQGSVIAYPPFVFESDGDLSVDDDDLQGLVTTLDSVVDTISTNIATIESETNNIETDVGLIKTDVDAIATDTGTIDTNVADIETLITTLNSLITTLDAVVDTIEANQTGVQYLSDAQLLTSYPGLNVARGQVSGMTTVHTYGRSEDIGTSEDLVWPGGTTAIPWQTSAQSLEVVSDSTFDTNGSSGAKTVTVVTLDNTWALSEQDVAMNGTTAVAMTGTHMRVLSAYVKEGNSGSTSPNRGNISVQIASGGSELCRIPQHYGQNQEALYTIPLNKTGYITGWGVGMEGFGTTNTVDWKLFTNNNNDTPTLTTNNRRGRVRGAAMTNENGTSVASFDLRGASIEVGSKTDVWITATSSGSGADGFAWFNIVLIDD